MKIISVVIGLVAVLMLGYAVGAWVSKVKITSAQVSPVLAMLKQIRSDMESGKGLLAEQRIARMISNMEQGERTPEQFYHEIMTMTEQTR